MKVNKLNEKFRVIHPDYGTLIAIGAGSYQLGRLMMMITGRTNSLYAIDDGDTEIQSGLSGCSAYNSYLITANHFEIINQISKYQDEDDERELVSLDEYRNINLSEYSREHCYIDGEDVYFVKLKPEPFKWIKDRSPMDELHPSDKVMVYSKDCSQGHWDHSTAGRVAKTGRPWAHLKHKDQFSASNPAPSPFNQD